MARKLSRRDFLVRSAAGGAALKAAGRGPTVFAAPKDAPGSRIGLGIIGAGARVHSDLLPTALGMPGVEVVGVCDAYKGRVVRTQQRTEGRAKEYPDWKALLADPGIDAVIISTPDHWHKDQTVAALAAGKDVYLEKPMTYRIEEGPQMIAAASRHNRILQVGSQGISSKRQETAREWIRAGRLGKVTLVRAAYNRNTRSGAWLYPIPPDADEKTVDFAAFLGPAPRRPFSLERFFRWRCYWDYSGGLATDLFVHLLTTVHYLLDASMPSRVVALGQNYRFKDTHEVPDTLNAILEYPEGFTVVLGCTFNSEAGGGFEFLGTEASLVLRDSQIELRPEHPVEGNDWIVASWPEEMEKAYFEDPKVVAAERPDRWAPRLQARGETLGEVGEDATKIHMARFFDSVRTRRPPVEDAERGHRAAAAAHLVNESVRRGGRPVEWDAAAGAILRA
jgi:predicted dehydrogenase